MVSFFKRHKQVILYGTALAILLLLLKWLEWKFVIMSHALDLYSGAISIVFTGLGIWLALKLAPGLSHRRTSSTSQTPAAPLPPPPPPPPSSIPRQHTPFLSVRPRQYTPLTYAAHLRHSSHPNHPRPLRP